MINFGMLNTNTNPMGDMLRGSQITAELKKAQNQYNVQDALYQLSQKPNPTYQDYEGIMNNYPQLAEVVKAPMANIDEKRRRVAEQNFAPVMAAAQNGRLDYVGDLLKKQEEAYINSGDSENAQAVQTMRKMFELDPAVGKTTLGLMGMAVAPDTMKSIFAQSKLDTENLKNTAQAGQALAAARKADIEAQYTPAQTKAEIDAKAASAYAAMARGDYDAAQMAQLPYKQAREDAEFFATQEEKRQQLAKLPESTVKFINDVTVAAGDAGRAASKTESFARKFDQLANDGYSSVDAVISNLKNKVLSKDDLMMLIDEANRLKNSEAVKNIPKPASDTDLRFALESLPKNSDSPAVWARYMRGLTEGNRWVQTYNQMQAQWAENNRGSLGALKNDAIINGGLVKAGSDFNKFAAALARREKISADDAEINR